MAQIIPARIALAVPSVNPLNSKPLLLGAGARGRDQPVHGHWVRLLKLGKLAAPRAKYGLENLTELSCNLFSVAAWHLRVLEILTGPWWECLGRFCSVL